MGLFGKIVKAVTGGKSVADTVVSTGEGVAGIIDKFVQTPDEKAAVQMELKRFFLDQEKLAMEKDQQILNDRQGARQMAGVHGKLQTSFALTFLICFILLLIGEFVVIGFITKWAISPEAIAIPGWIQALISSTLTGVLAYMVSMVKEIVGFLFGGSAGGDQSGAAMVEMFAQNNRIAEENAGQEGIPGDKM